MGLKCMHGYETCEDCEAAEHVMMLDRLRKQLEEAHRKQKAAEDLAETLIAERDSHRKERDSFMKALSNNLGFHSLRAVNAARCRRWHPPGSVPWTSADWSNAVCGEAGELANVVKKIRRHETGAKNEGDPSLDELMKMAAAEVADVVIYADLVADYFGIDLGEAVREKFNQTSWKYGFPERL